MLHQEFSATKVLEEAVFKRNHLSSLDRDGFWKGFLQKHWNIIGQDIYVAILVAPNFNRWTYGINETFIVMIPKTKNPTKVSKFKPIRLYNVVYKIIAKVLANRLKTILLVIISSPKVPLSKLEWKGKLDTWPWNWTWLEHMIRTIKTFLKFLLKGRVLPVKRLISLWSVFPLFLINYYLMEFHKKLLNLRRTLSRAILYHLTYLSYVQKLLARYSWRNWSN